MILNAFLLLPLFRLACASLKRGPGDSGCHADNCLRAIRATSILPQASLDCSSFLDATSTPPPVTVTVTSTTTALAQRGVAYYDPIPPYASPCTDAVEYSSACSCIGVTPSTTTLAAVSTTVTAIATATPSCAGQSCATGFVPSCDEDNTDCFCFTNAEEDGFCGENAPCASLTPCYIDDDCDVPFASGDTCAFSTCCSAPDGSEGYCLVGVCGNPSAKLAKMAMAARNHLVGDTAAFRAQ